MEHITENTSNESSKEATVQRLWKILKVVNDPEIPVLTVMDLGIIRDIKIEDKIVEVIITPTYSGCPAMDFIGMNIRKALRENGYDQIKITHRLSPAWTTDWMTEEGKDKLRSYGIAPPVSKTFDKKYLQTVPVRCPHCSSPNTKLISEFGSTACKAIYQCKDCGEPFDYFKCH
jgi:ring-1,2-phenylacetyl-CoA epoxidase subunit PaaD